MFFSSPYFDLDAFMQRALHILDATVILDQIYENTDMLNRSGYIRLSSALKMCSKI